MGNGWMLRLAPEHGKPYFIRNEVDVDSVLLPGNLVSLIEDYEDAEDVEDNDDDLEASEHFRILGVVSSEASEDFNFLSDEDNDNYLFDLMETDASSDLDYYPSR